MERKGRSAEGCASARMDVDAYVWPSEAIRSVIRSDFVQTRSHSGSGVSPENCLMTVASQSVLELDAVVEKPIRASRAFATPVFSKRCRCRRRRSCAFGPNACLSASDAPPATHRYTVAQRESGVSHLACGLTARDRVGR